MVSEEVCGAGVQYILRPDRSLSWQGNMRFFLVMSSVSLSIAAWFAWQGAWMIFPFAGIELGLLYAALYVVSSRGLECQVIQIEGENVEISTGKRCLQSVSRFQRHWARVVFQQTDGAWYPRRLYISSHGKMAFSDSCYSM